MAMNSRHIYICLTPVGDSSFDLIISFRVTVFATFRSPILVYSYFYHSRSRSNRGGNLPGTRAAEYGNMRVQASLFDLLALVLGQVRGENTLHLGPAKIAKCTSTNFYNSKTKALIIKLYM